VLKTGHCGKQLRNTLKVLKCGAGEGSWADRVKKKYYTEKKNILHTRKRKACWIGKILSTNFLLKQVSEGKIEGAGSRGRRRKKLPNGIKEKRKCWTRERKH
jgi:hypothetical protein